MALINRLSRLFKADFHAVLDQIEEPELLLKQAIREMEAVGLKHQETRDFLPRQHFMIFVKPAKGA